ncbi:MAG: hypothetical protein Aurels2KO_14810 [Aureliella sp.]
MSENDDVEVRARKSYWLPILLVVFGMPILLIGVAVALLAWRDSAARSRLEQRIEVLQAEGMPVDEASLNAFYQSQTSDEQTEAWEQLLDEMKAEAFLSSTSGVPVFDGNLSSEQYFVAPGEPWEYEKRTREFLEQRSDLHDRAMRLSMRAIPTRWDVRLSFGGDLTRTQELRSVERLLSLRGQLAIYDSDSAATTRAINALWRLPTVTAGEPFLISQLVRSAIGGRATLLLKNALEHGVLRQHEIEMLLPQVLEGTIVGSSWRMGIIGERALAMPLIRGISVGEEHPVTSLPFRSSDANYYLDITDRMIEISSADPVELYNKARNLDKELGLERADMGFLAMFDTMLSTTVVPSLANVAVAHSSSAFQNRLAALAMGVRLYEYEHGEFPEKLVDVAEFGADATKLMPPGGEPFGYRREGGGSATLWGFEVGSSKQAVVPESPPVKAAGPPNSTLEERWVYRLRTM